MNYCAMGKGSRSVSFVGRVSLPWRVLYRRLHYNGLRYSMAEWPVKTLLMYRFPGMRGPERLEALLQLFLVFGRGHGPVLAKRVLLEVILGVRVEFEGSSFLLVQACLVLLLYGQNHFGGG